jgi:hypothetical protein
MREISMATQPDPLAQLRKAYEVYSLKHDRPQPWATAQDLSECKQALKEAITAARNTVNWLEKDPPQRLASLEQRRLRDDLMIYTILAERTLKDPKKGGVP